MSNKLTPEEISVLDVLLETIHSHISSWIIDNIDDDDKWELAAKYIHESIARNLSRQVGVMNNMNEWLKKGNYL